MESTTRAPGAIVIHGSDEAFFRLVLGALPASSDATVIVVGSFSEAAFATRRIESVVTAGDANPELLSARTYAATIDDLAALLEPFGDRIVAVLQRVDHGSALSVAHAVKRGGGAVIAVASEHVKPERTTAAFVDFSVAADELAHTLAAMFEEAGDDRDLADDEQLLAFLRLVRQRTGIDFAQYKMSTIRRRLQRLMIAAKVKSLGDFSRHLQHHPDEYQRLVHEFLIKVTDFFRDDELFDYLRSEILPEAIARVKADDGELRIWSAGCATGEEAYSLAILVAELYGPDLERANVKIFATDLDETAINFARRGIYSRSALGAMPPEWIERYFQQTPGGFEVRKRIRTLTVFGQHDLGQRAPFPRTDLVLCRNVLIYFSRELQQRTLQLFAFSLRESGYLVLGKSESVSPAPEYFRAVNAPYRTFQRFGKRVLIPPPRIREPFAKRERSESESPSASAVRQRPRSEPARAGLFDRFGLSLFAGSTGYVVVDSRYDVVAINAEARRLLGVFGRGVGEDLIHLVEGTASAALRALLDVGLRGREAQAEIDTSNAPLAADTHRLLVTVYPERSPDGERTLGNAIVRVEDVSAAVREREASEAQGLAREREIERLIASHDQIVRVRDAFAVANQELSTANVELRSLNEHLLISVEESEASGEEIETLNEEMQATNEELETLNEELQATIEELNTTNDELHVRGLEIQNTGQERDVAMATLMHRDRELEGIFAEMPVAVVHFQADGGVDKMSDAYLALLGTYGDPLPFRPVTPGTLSSPLVRAARGETFEEEWQLGDDGVAERYTLRSQRLLVDGRGTILTVLKATT